MAVVSDFTALIGGAHWANVSGQATSNTPTIITYSFPTTFPQAYLTRYGAGAAGTFLPFTASDQAMARQALNAWASVSGITFVEVPGALGDIRFLWIDGTTATADPLLGTSWGGQGFFPFAPFYFDSATNRILPQLQQYWTDQGTNYGLGGATAYNTTVQTRGDIGIGVLLHEIGHALGLKHPFDGATTLDPVLDRKSNTIMSYTRDVRPDSLGPLDVQAAQYLYGWADRDGTQLANWRYDPATLTFTLEGGSGADVIRGTNLRDVMQGGSGNDAIAGWSGDDRLIPGPGDDRVGGGTGFDTVVFGVPRAGAEITRGTYWTTVRSSEGLDWIAEVERYQFTDLILAFDASGNAGQAYRIYQAAFARIPDRGGLSYWVDRIDDGLSLRDAAAGFIGSAEFRAAYGATATPEQHIAKFYQNVLGRAGEAGGVAFWTAELRRGVPLADVLVGFSESPENVGMLAATLARGIELDLAAFM